MVLVEDLARLGDVDGVAVLDRPGQLGQPFEIGARHRILAGRFGHALQPRQLLLGVRLDLLRHLGFGDLLGAARRSPGPWVVAFAQLLLDRAQLLAQQELALAARRWSRACARRCRATGAGPPAGGRGIRARDRAAPWVVDLEDLLLFRDRDVHEAGDQVGQRRRRGDDCSVDQLVRRIGKQLQHLDRLLAQLQHARVDLGSVCLRFLDTLDTRHEEGKAVEELDDAEAPLAAADDVVAAVGRRRVAQLLPIVPIACRSAGPGSAISASRCRTTPSGDLLRTACWIAASERGRATLKGMTTPGKRMLLRIGKSAAHRPAIARPRCRPYSCLCLSLPAWRGRASPLRVNSRNSGAAFVMIVVSLPVGRAQRR